MAPTARLISLGILTVLIVVLAIMFYQVLAPFLLPLFLAGIVAVLVRPLYLYFALRTKDRRRLAAGLTTGLIVVSVLLPLTAGTVIGAIELIHVAQRTLRDREWRNELQDFKQQPWVANVARRIEPFVNDGQISPSTLTEEQRAEQLEARIDASLRATFYYLGQKTIGAVGFVPSVAIGFLGRLVGLLVASVIFVIALYYFLCDGPVLLIAARTLIPVREDYQRQLLERFDTVVRAVVLSTFLAALVQGALTTIALLVAGFGHPIVLFVLSSLCAMIPLAGTWLVWGPCAIVLAVKGQWLASSMLALFGLAVIGTVDNVVRTFILNNDAKLHPLLAFVSVLGGLQAMGLWGVFIGPVVAACLHALMQIFNTELQAFSQERVATDKPDGQAAKPLLAPPDPGPVAPLASSDPVDHSANPATANAGSSGSISGPAVTAKETSASRGSRSRKRTRGR